MGAVGQGGWGGGGGGAGNGVDFNKSDVGHLTTLQSSASAILNTNCRYLYHRQLDVVRIRLRS